MISLVLIFEIDIICLLFLKVVDFSMPFLDLGISILFVKAPEKSVNLFAFLLPLSQNVWLLMIFAGFAVSVVMYGIAK